MLILNRFFGSSLMIVDEVKITLLAPGKGHQIKVLLAARSMLGTQVQAAYVIERTVPTEPLALCDRLWFGGDGKDPGPFTAARRAWDHLTVELDRWEQALEAEAAGLCRDVLGIAIGDIVLAETGPQPVRIRSRAWTSMRTTTG